MYDVLFSLHPASGTLRQLAAEIVLLNLSATAGSWTHPFGLKVTEHKTPLCTLWPEPWSRSKSSCVHAKKSCRKKSSFGGLKIQEAQLLVTLRMVAHWVVIACAKQNFFLLLSVLEWKAKLTSWYKFGLVKLFFSWLDFSDVCTMMILQPVPPHGTGN